MYFSKNTVCSSLFVFITSCIMYLCLSQTYFNSIFTDIHFFKFENFWSGSVALRHKATLCCFSITSCGFICSIHKIRSTLFKLFIWGVWKSKTSSVDIAPHATSHNTRTTKYLWVTSNHHSPFFFVTLILCIIFVDI